MQTSPISPNVQKAVAFFQQAEFPRLLKKLRQKYVEEGEVRGQVLLEDSTPAERREIASFLGKRAYSQVQPAQTARQSSQFAIRVRMVDFDTALKRSVIFDCTLPELLSAFFPDQPLVTRQAERVARATRHEDFRASLVGVATALPDGSRGRRWLEEGQHGLEWFYARYRNATDEERAQQMILVLSVATMLNQLPHPDHPERLGLFAQRTSGDPHMLDLDMPAGRLFLLALHDLTSERTESDVQSLEEALSPSTSVQDRAHALRLYAGVGLLVDMVSSNVAVFHLVDATYYGGTRDPLPQAAGERVLLLPLRQLLEWQWVQPASADSYVFENPQVFEEVVAALSSSTPARTPTKTSEHKTAPTLICTAGWPSVAALMLLDLILAQSAGTLFHYSGDFDLKGLQIAAHFMTRCPGRCLPWRFDVDAYGVALNSGGVIASERELAMLNTLPDHFAPLVAEIQARGRWAYQEGIAHLLIKDVLL